MKHRNACSIPPPATICVSKYTEITFPAGHTYDDIYLIVLIVSRYDGVLIFPPSTCCAAFFWSASLFKPLCCANALLSPNLAPKTAGIGMARRYTTSASKLNLNVLNEIENLFSSNSRQQASWPKVEVPPDFIVPEPRPLTITESTDLGKFAVATAGLALRLATGAFVLGWKVDTILAPEDGRYALQLGPLRIRDSSSVLSEAAQPAETIVLYEEESSPSCKRVREMMNLLDITYECRPCFGENDGQPLPYIEDPNTDQTISGDDEILEHLLQQYGPPVSLYDRKALWPITFREFSLLTSKLAARLRGSQEMSKKQPNARPDNANMKPIELWAYECSPFVQPVKQKLSSLGLPHRLVSCSRGSKNRDRMMEKTGRFQVPYIVDSNTGIEMFEGAEIVEYLEAVYTVKQ